MRVFVRNLLLMLSAGVVVGIVLVALGKFSVMWALSFLAFSVLYSVGRIFFERNVEPHL